ncbi:hypothetical protein [Brevibacillus marinus]|uniref:hypothetical protein n=1 Tax=Brevibacillus marinus TaxID=2496837 RepID=UPI000F821736|nr:hypothetical protein [Brevibacillus marinus]
MPDANTVARICERLSKSGRQHGIADFHLSFAESETLCDDRGRTMEGSGTLTLAWRDGSISVHHLDRSAACWTELPFAEWRQLRFPARQPLRLYRAVQEHPYPRVKLFDRQVARLLQNDALPPVPAHFCRKLTRLRQWAAHSRGMMLEAETTLVELRHRRFAAALTYHSRRYPSAEELAYLATEAKWFTLCAPADRQLVADPQAEHDLYLLFSPEAFRALLHHGIAVHLLADASDAAASAVLHWCRSSQLPLYVDPLRPWSWGSYRFTPSGLPAAPVALSGPAAGSEPVRDRYDRQSLHWRPNRCQSFNHLLQSVDHFCLVSELHLPERFSPFDPVTLWAPQTIRFHGGRPVLRGMLPLTITLSRLLANRQLLFVERIGWDGTGVAVPNQAMGDDS